MLQALLSFVRAGGVLPSKAVSGDLHKVSQGGGGTHDGHRGALEVLPTALLQLRRTRRLRRRRWRPPSLYSFSLGSILSEPTGPTAAGAVGQRPTTVNLKPLRQALGASLYEKKTGSFVITLVKRSIGEHVSFDKCIDPARLPVEGALIASSCHVASTASACLPRRGCRRPPWTRFVPVVGLPRRPFRPLPPGFFPAHLPPDFFPPLFSSPSLLLHLVVSSVAQPNRWLPSSPAVPALVSSRRLRLLPLFTPPPPFTPAPPCTLPPPPRCPLWAAPPPPPTAV